MTDPRTRAALAALLTLGALLPLRHPGRAPFDFHPTRQYYGAIIARDVELSLRRGVPAEARAAARESRRDEALLEPPLIPAVTGAVWAATGRESFAVPRVIGAVAWALGALSLWSAAGALGLTQGAWIAALFMLFHPYAMRAGTALMPDATTLALCLAALAAMLRPRGDRSVPYDLCVPAGAAVFLKLFPVLLLAPLLAALPGARARLRSPRALALAALCALPAGLWYVNGFFLDGFLRSQSRGRFVPSLLATRGFWADWWGRVDLVAGHGPFLAACASALLLARGTARRALLGWLAGYALYAVTFTFHARSHDYYSLPLLPWTALALGVAAEGVLPRRARWPAVALAAVIAAAGVRSAWRAVDASLAQGREVVATSAALRAALGCRRGVLFQGAHYGLPYEFHGCFSAALFPDADARAEAHPGVDAATLLRTIHPGERFARFVLTDRADLARQPDLAALVAARGRDRGRFVMVDLLAPPPLRGAEGQSGSMAQRPVPSTASPTP